MFLYLVEGTVIDKSFLRAGAKRAFEYLEKIRGQKIEAVLIGSHIDMKAADGSVVVGWLASQTDMLAVDWECVD